MTATGLSTRASSTGLRLHPAEDTLVPQHTAARAELAVIEQELSRLSQAVAQGGELPALLDALRARERRRQVLQDDLAALERFRHLGTVDLARLERDARERLSDFQGLLTRQVRHTRQLLKQLLVGRIVFRPTEGPTYEFVGQASFGGLLAGVVGPKAGVAPYLKALRRSSVQLCAVYSSVGAWFFRAA